MNKKSAQVLSSQSTKIEEQFKVNTCSYAGRETLSSDGTSSKSLARKTFTHHDGNSQISLSSANITNKKWKGKSNKTQTSWGQTSKHHCQTPEHSLFYGNGPSSACAKH
ncbi:uncharacterized protein FRV6_01170 [Fusarium oxysporum]|uniref:Uncharacterized protein n=1 Tax=Fusarium oxysporum TaxID=5507 RepID=A0A2H3SKF2_FUSOX|nr:uncharacterized protein FRV6_01170 [Fusarium oxysporum]